MNTIVEIAIERIERARRDGYEKGFLAGEAVGRKHVARHADRALGIGVCIGAGIGVIIALFVVPYLARFA